MKISMLKMCRKKSQGRVEDQMKMKAAEKRLRAFTKIE